MAVYSHIKDGPVAQQRAVISVLFHESDHKDSTVEQKKYYHRYCDSACDFYRHWKAKLPLEDFKKNTTQAYKDDSGISKEVPWEAGIFAGLDYCYPLAYKQLLDHMGMLANLELLSRCGTLRTSNANESIHSKFFKCIDKDKDYGVPRFEFIAEQIALRHNFGYYKSSMLHVFGTMGKRAKVVLQQCDRDAARVSKRVYASIRTHRGKTHRAKVKHQYKPQEKAPCMDNTARHSDDPDEPQCPPQENSTPMDVDDYPSPPELVHHSNISRNSRDSYSTPPYLSQETGAPFPPLYTPPPYPPSPSPPRTEIREPHTLPSHHSSSDEGQQTGPPFSPYCTPPPFLPSPSPPRSAFREQPRHHSDPDEGPSCPPKKRKNPKKKPKKAPRSACRESHIPPRYDYSSDEGSSCAPKKRFKKLWIQSGAYGQDDD